MRFCHWGPGRVPSKRYSRPVSAAPVEELNLAVHEPLYAASLALNDRKGDKSSLLEDAGCFLCPVCGGRFKLIRLQLVFEEVYSKRFRTVLPG